MSELCACGCGASLDGLRSDAVYASDACRMRARRPQTPNKGLTDRERVLRLLRDAGAVGVHSHDIRRWGYSGNPSQRIADLEELDGHRIRRVREARNDRPGARFFLIIDADNPAGSSVATPKALPPSPGGAASSGSTSGSLDAAGSGGARKGRSSGTLFDDAPESVEASLADWDEEAA